MLGYNLCCHWFQKGPKKSMKLWHKDFFKINPSVGFTEPSGTFLDQVLAVPHFS